LAENYDPKTSAIHALNDIDVKAPPQMVSKEMELVSKSSKRIILATGATGQQGGAVYQHLQKKGYKLRALAERIDGILHEP
jgi:hypothetical protein